MKLIVKAPAKLNLGLDSPFIHNDGSLEWNMIMTSIGLSDYILIETNEHSNQIQVFSDSGFLPEDGRNLAFQAAKIFVKEAQLDVGINISIEKHIPVAAGLGGGSSDAAAVLRGLNEIFETNYSLEKLARLGLQIDSDVPYCVYSKTSLVSGRGEIITPLPKLPKMKFVIAKPDISVSTPRILKKIKHSELDHPNIPQLLTGINEHNYQEIITNMGNALEPITSSYHSQITALKQRMLSSGADVAQMSGSGPTVFCVCSTESRAKRIYNSISGFCNEVYLTQPIYL